MTLLIAGLALFLGIHSLVIFAPGAREALVQKLGPNAWRGIHSLFSLVGLALIFIGYGEARQAPVFLYTPPSWTRHVTFTLMLPVFPLILAAYLPGRIRAALKHPMLVADWLNAKSTSAARARTPARIFSSCPGPPP